MYNTKKNKNKIIKLQEIEMERNKEKKWIKQSKVSIKQLEKKKMK